MSTTSFAFSTQESTAQVKKFAKVVYQKFTAKLDEMRKMDEQNSQLRLRVAELEVQNAMLDQKKNLCHEEKRATTIKEKALKEGGVPEARTLASLPIPAPELLSIPPKAVFEQGLKFFQEGNFEQASRAFISLLENKENNSFEIAQVYYLTGISLYKLKNFIYAERYLERVVPLAKGKDVAYAPKALSWIALCYLRLDQKAQSKIIVRQIIEKYPKSKEARRLNKRG